MPKLALSWGHYGIFTTRAEHNLLNKAPNDKVIATQRRFHNEPQLVSKKNQNNVLHQTKKFTEIDQQTFYCKLFPSNRKLNRCWIPALPVIAFEIFVGIG